MVYVVEKYFKTFQAKSQTLTHNKQEIKKSYRKF